MTSSSIWIFLRWRMCLQHSTLFIGRIMSRPKTIWPGFLPLVLWYIDRTAKAASDRIHIHGSESSEYFPCRLYVCTRFPNTLYIISMIAFTCRFPGESVFILILHSSYIKLFLSSWPGNYPPRSYVIYTGQGHPTSHVVSTKFTIVIFSSHYITLFQTTRLRGI